MQNVTGKDGQKSLVIALLGALVVAAIWYAISMSLVTTLIFGLPIGAVGALIVYRTVARMSRKSPPSIGAQSSNGSQLAQKKREDARPASPVKLE